MQERVLYITMTLRLVLIWLAFQIRQEPTEAIEIKKGDILIGCYGHWTYFFSDREYFHLNGNRGGHPYLEFCTWSEDDRNYFRDKASWGWAVCRAPDVKMKDGKPIPKLNDEQSRKLALRMSDLVGLYVSVTQCHCKHYVDYVIYGTTFGSWFKPSHLPINDDCPLHRRITDETNIDDPEFYLSNARKPHPQHFRLPKHEPPPPPPSKPRWSFPSAHARRDSKSGG